MTDSVFSGFLKRTITSKLYKNIILFISLVPNVSFEYLKHLPHALGAFTEAKKIKDQRKIQTILFLQNECILKCVGYD